LAGDETGEEVSPADGDDIAVAEAGRTEDVVAARKGVGDDVSEFYNKLFSWNTNEL
jgi:hypothetical protein